MNSINVNKILDGERVKKVELSNLNDSQKGSFAILISEDKYNYGVSYLKIGDDSRYNDCGRSLVRRK